MDEEISFDELIEKIQQWHFDRRITVNGNSITQTVKLGEEYGELCAALVRNDTKGIMDSIGDMIVVLTAIANLQGFELKECVTLSYDEIKDRKGYLNKIGNFIKEE